MNPDETPTESTMTPDKKSSIPESGVRSCSFSMAVVSTIEHPKKKELTIASTSPNPRLRDISSVFVRTRKTPTMIIRPPTASSLLSLSERKIALNMTTNKTSEDPPPRSASLPAPMRPTASNHKRTPIATKRDRTSIQNHPFLPSPLVNETVPDGLTVIRIRPPTIEGIAVTRKTFRSSMFSAPSIATDSNATTRADRSTTDTYFVLTSTRSLRRTSRVAFETIMMLARAQSGLASDAVGPF
ncbi:MAG: hypothetical protein A3K60_04860 [Euryarchaeota archaeon RBG_19FT_COMBO_56_21]|nr:MAG: hypothetical protein A3K60_04860 [Euryarchaeota archaeon RBG_19FT_COMBO_56_21]